MYLIFGIKRKYSNIKRLIKFSEIQSHSVRDSSVVAGPSTSEPEVEGSNLSYVILSIMLSTLRVAKYSNKFLTPILFVHKVHLT